MTSHLVAKLGFQAEARLRRLGSLALAVAALMVLASGVTSASAAFLHPHESEVFGPDGTASSGGFGGGTVEGIRFDQTNKRLYVLRRLYDEAGGPPTQIPRGIYGFDMSAPGTHIPLSGSFPIPILAPTFTPFFAVDETEGNIYYVDDGSYGKSPPGTLYGFDSSGAPLGGAFPVPLSRIAEDETVEPLRVEDGTVDPLGYLWLKSAVGKNFYKYSPSGALISSIELDAVETVFDRFTGDVWALRYFGEEGVVIRLTASSDYTEYDHRFPVPSPFFNTGEMAVDAKHGIVYLTPNYGSEIFAYNETGGLVETLSVGEEFPDFLGKNATTLAVNEETGEIYYVNRGLFLEGAPVHVWKGVVVPDVTTGPPSNVDHTSIAVTGHLDLAGGPNVTSCKFEYGTDVTYGLGSVPCAPSASPGSPITSATDVEAEIPGLTTGTEYHYRLVASNSNGTNVGNDEMAIAQPSLVKTGAASEVQRAAATLNGTVDPEGLETTFYFQYGKTRNYGQLSDPEPGIGVGTTAPSAQPVGKPISGLEPGATYHYRLVAINAKGTSYGVDRTFTTSPAVKHLGTDPATSVGRGTAALHGTLDPDGLETEFYFEWGTSKRYGQSSAIPPGADLGTTTPGDIQRGFVAEGLRPATTYHYRIVASNPTYGTTLGNDRTFTTLPAVAGIFTDPATDVQLRSATLNGRLDPDGLATTFYFDWGKTSSYGHTTTAPPGVDVGSSDPGSAELAAGLTELEPGTTYHYRLVAHNSFGTTFGLDRSFATPAPPSIEGVFSANVSAKGADLKARINPNGSEPSFQTTYRFEYGATSGYGSTAPVPDGLLAPATSGQSVTASLSGLQEVTYHFRLVAENDWGTTTSEDQTFNFNPPSCPNAAVRQQTGAAYLPDCRAYELASPARTGGASLSFFGPTSPYAANRLAFTGAVNAIPGAGDPPNVDLRGDLYVASRTASGWHTHYVGLAGNETFGQGAAPDTEVYGPAGMPADLNLNKFLTWRRASNGIRSYAPYLWDNEGSALGRLPTNLEEVPGGSDPISAGGFVGAIKPSPDFSHYVFSSRNLTFAPGGQTNAPGSVYDNNIAARTVAIVSKTAAGTDIPQDASAGGSDEYVRVPAVSKDGSHILMSTEAPGGTTHLYMRVDDAVSYDISLGEDQENHGVHFDGMTEDGSAVYFTTAARMSADDHDSSIDLYRWAENGGAPQLNRLSQGIGGSGDSDSCNPGWIASCGVEVVPTDNHFVFALGFATSKYQPIDTALGAQSGDIYFYSPEELEGARGVPGKRNLYLWHSGVVHHVATLDALGPAERINVSPDGTHMAFITKTKIGAYDNAGQTEMLTYDPAARALLCVSCKADGSPPASDVQGSQNGIFLTDDGRAFFATADALVPRDANGISDVYEYVDGSASLISTGTGDDGGSKGREIGLVGVSANGTDAFISTYQTLVAEDENGPFYKFYDARVNGGFPFSKPAAPCAAADECHGDGSAIPVGGQVGSGANLGPSGNVTSASKRKAHKHKKRRAHHRKTKRHRGKGRR